VVSHIPTLILAGENDPITPPAWAKLAAQTLRKSHTFVFPLTAHGVLLGFGPAALCSQSMLSAFLANPTATPDSTCMDTVKASFVTK
jgi:pimeloyl-ACP methyl ester carboxylesterase